MEGNRTKNYTRQQLTTKYTGAMKEEMDRTLWNIHKNIQFPLYIYHKQSCIYQPCRGAFSEVGAGHEHVKQS